MNVGWRLSRAAAAAALMMAFAAGPGKTQTAPEEPPACKTLAGDSQAACNAVQAALRRFSEALATRDYAAARAVHDPQYTERQTHGESFDLDEVAVGWVIFATSELKLTWAIEQFTLAGAEATALVRWRFLTQGVAQEAFDRIEVLARQHWARSGEGWIMQRSELESSKIWQRDKLLEDTKILPPPSPAEREAIVKDIAARAHPFSTVRAGSGFDDLAFLDAVIGDARIVALGEASHGTAEFFQMKHRLLEYLVEKKGFTVFAIEGNWPEALAADRYIKAGESDAAAALAAMYFWTWQTEEVRDMLDWMRRYNQTRGSRPELSFTGFDMQTASVAARHAAELYAKAGSVDLNEIRRLYADVQPFEATGEAAKNPGSDEFKARIGRIRDNAVKALELTRQRRQELIKVTSLEAYEEGLHAARTVLQAAEMNATPGFAGSSDVRDEAMAENVRWLAETRFPGKKIVLWAHNGHVAAAPFQRTKTMGTHLRETYGAQMVVLGFASNKGTVRAVSPEAAPDPLGNKLGPLPLVAAKPLSVDGYFAATAAPRLIVDLRTVPADSPFGRWLSAPRMQREIGALYAPSQASYVYQETDLRAAYDALIFVADVNAAKELK